MDEKQREIILVAIYSIKMKAILLLKIHRNTSDPFQRAKKEILKSL